jgi:hypothetical protein
MNTSDDVYCVLGKLLALTSTQIPNEAIPDLRDRLEELQSRKGGTLP